MSFRDGLVHEFATADPLAVLRAPVTALLGVGTPTTAVFADLGILTVFDLATAPLFVAAASIAEASASDAVGVPDVPGAVVVPGGPTSIDEVAASPLAVLRGLDATLAATIQSTLQISVIADLGRWPPFTAARAILRVAARATAYGTDDEDDTSKLVPGFGDFPTERHFYSTLVIDQIGAGQTTDLAQAGPIDIAPTADDYFGFSQPAVGARLTFRQSWFTQGLTLGNLLHSVALAPGESTRIAVVDWSRQTKATSAESVSETESLTNATTHNRAVNEVQDAVATEVQSGFSSTNSHASTSEGGGGLGFSYGPLTIGGSASGGTTDTSASSFSSSYGSRELAASMNQQITDATQQAASSVRNRRATIVKEVSESEHEAVSTRILANYNHMHALTVQYFEVVETHRVVIDLQRAERCLFVPMKLVDFTDALIERYQGALAAAGLDRRSRELLTTEFGAIRVTPSVPMGRRPVVFDRGAVLATAARAWLAARESAAAEPPDGGTVTTPPASTPPPAVADPPFAAWDAGEVEQLARFTGLKVLRPGASDLFVPDDAQLAAVSFQPLTGAASGVIPVSAVALALRSGSQQPAASAAANDWEFLPAVSLTSIDRILVSSSSDAVFRGRMVLELVYHSLRFPVSLPVELRAHAAAQDACLFGAPEAGPELKRHLEAHRLHYSQTIYRALDPSAIALLLSAFSFEGRAVADQIDPNPIAVAANYLVFRMPGFVDSDGVKSGQTPASAPEEAKARTAWKTWLTERGIVIGSAARSESLVAVPTGGVFAEAVLGRSSAAEKLDITRFWNWQDSPIPLQPPEISAIQLGSRAQPTNITPGQLGQPVLNIVNPTQLPDPTGLGAILGAVQNGSMFRDMAGLAATIGLAQSAGGQATDAAADASKLAAANLAVAAQKDIEQQKIAAQVALAAMGLPSVNGGTPTNISEMGALINSAGERDRAQPAGGGNGTTSTPGGDGDGGSGPVPSPTDPSPPANGGDTMPGIEPPFADAGGGSLEEQAFQRAIWGGLGLPVGSIILAKGTKPTKASGHELSVVANFPYPWTTLTAELDALDSGSGRWFPSAKDWLAIAGKNPAGRMPFTIDTFGELLGAILESAQRGKIRRLNFFSHANPGEIAMKGAFNTITGDVTWQQDADDPIHSEGIDVSVVSEMKSRLSADTGLAKRLKDAWTPEAELWLYACHAGTGTALPKELANLFGVTVRAFDGEIRFFPDYQRSPDKMKSRDCVGVGNTQTRTLHRLDTLAKSFT
ncbi:hypothetical protein [Streptomyces phaeochromogenes]